MQDSPPYFHSRRGSGDLNDMVGAETPPVMPDIWSVRYIDLGDIRTDRIVRDRWYVTESSVEQLQRSILQVGLLSPILVEPRDDDLFELINGQRRLRAFQGLAKTRGHFGDFTVIPALVFPPAGRAETRYCRMIEDNLMQKPLQHFELAHLANDFASDSQTEASTLESAVGVLFHTMESKTKQDIVHFSRLMRLLDSYVLHWDAVSLPLARALSVALAASDAALPRLRLLLSRCPRSRDASTEQNILWKVAGGAHVSRARCRLDEAEVSVSVRGKTPNADELRKALLAMADEIR